jgi:hypothetical protein
MNADPMERLVRSLKDDLDEARAALARRDTTIAAVRDLADDMYDILQTRQDENWLAKAEYIQGRLLAALSAPVEAGTTEPAQVGRCGATTGLRLPLRDHPSCELPAGHAGFHRDGNTEWGRSWVDPPEKGTPAEAVNIVGGTHTDPGNTELDDAIEVIVGDYVADTLVRTDLAKRVLAEVVKRTGLGVYDKPLPGAPAEPASDTEECDECGHPRTDHPGDRACRAVLRPLWAPDDECWCGRYVAALAGAADTAREDEQ